VFGFETALVAGSILVATVMQGSSGDGGSVLWKILLATSLYELCFYYNDLYDLTLVNSRGELLIRVLQAAAAGAIVLPPVAFVMPSLVLGHGTFLTSLGLTLVAVPAWRWTFEGVTRDPHLEERVLIVGTGSTARAIAQQIGRQRNFAYRLIGFV